MLKTIYSKYLVSFIALIGIGFLAIAVIICSVVTNYSINTKTELMNKTAEMVYLEVSNEMMADDCDFETAIMKNSEKYKNVFGILADYSESDIILFNRNGKILYETAEDTVFASLTLGKKTMDEIKNNAGLSRLGDLNGLFRQRRFNYIYPVEESVSGQNSTIGYIILTSSASGMSQVFEQIIKVIIVSSLWVFLAAIIIVYFITDRITTPIKQISRAVKSYAKGNFDVRIPVKGEDEIATLSEAFNNMANSMEKLEETRNTFLANISHDLRTPMTSIAGIIDCILELFI